MKSKLLKEDNYSISDWSGGKTRQLASFPPKSIYSDRDFIWRLSSATVELEESDFSKLPDYDRVLMVLEGSVVLTYDDSRTVRLKELEQDSFDGAWKTKSFGKITDFNLMTRKGTDGKVDLIAPTSQAEIYGDTLNSERSCKTHALYCKEGYCVVNAGGNSIMMNPGNLLVMEFFDEKPEYSIMGEGVIIRSQMGFDFDYSEEYKDPENAGAKTKEDAEAEIAASRSFDSSKSVSKGGGAAEDYKWSFILANTQFRGAKHIFRRLQKLWYDDELHEKIKRLERIFITFAVYLLGFMILTFVFMKDNATEMKIIWILLIWTLIDCLIVSPIIYYMALPKPIASHIFDLEKVSKEERNMMLQRADKNERLEKLLKKYKNSGRNFTKSRYEDD